MRTRPSVPATTSRRRRVLPVTAGLAATLCAVALTGCTGDPSAGGTTPASSATATPAAEPSTPAASPSDPPGPTPSATAGTDTPDDAPAAETPFPGGTDPVEQESSVMAQLSPVDLRFGAHDGYDRVVVDLVGDGTPGWRVRYVDEVTEDGSGLPVELAGSAYLVLTVTGVQYPTQEGGVDWAGPDRLTPAGAGVVAELVYGQIYEGQMQLYVGLTQESPFRVSALTDPTRVVLDVATP